MSVRHSRVGTECNVKASEDEVEVWVEKNRKVVDEDQRRMPRHACGSSL